MVEQHLALECVRGRCGKYVESRDILDFDLKIDINLKEKFVTKVYEKLATLHLTASTLV